MSKGDVLIQKKNLLLRQLYEQGAIDPSSGISPEMLQKDVNLDEQDFRSLHVYLLHAKLIKGGPLIWLTDLGLNEALEHLKRTDDTLIAYQDKDRTPQRETILRIINLAEYSLRKAVRKKPSCESEVQEVFEALLIGTEIPYKREKESLEYSSKTYIPDFTFIDLDFVLDFKFCGTRTAEKRLIKEINDYIVAFRTRYTNLIFIVYDLGFIREVDRFTSSFEQQQNVFVRVVKH